MKIPFTNIHRTLFPGPSIHITKPLTMPLKNICYGYRLIYLNF